MEDLHRQRPPQEVTYSKNMPDIEALMQEWPPEVEQALRPRMGQLPGEIPIKRKKNTRLT